MTSTKYKKSRWVLPLPGFVLKPLTALIISLVHVYLAAGHLYRLFSGEVSWENIWKGFGALAGAYVFAALASRKFDQRKKEPKLVKRVLTEN